MLLFGKKKIEEFEATIEDLNRKLREKDQAMQAKEMEWQARVSQMQGEMDQKLQLAQGEAEKFRNALEKARSERDTIRKWGERQVRLGFEELKELWTKHKLPMEYLDCKEPPSEKKKEHLGSLIERLEIWMQQLEIDIRESHIYFGLWQRLLGNPREACRRLEVAAAKAIGDHVWRMLGDCYMELNRPEKAEEAYSHCINDPKVPLYVLVNYAKSCIRKRDFSAAADTLERCILRDSKEKEYYTLAAYALGMAKMYDKAVTLSQRAQEIFPDEPEVFAKMIIPLARIDRISEARLAFEKALKLDEKFAEAWFAWGVAHLDRDDNKAREYLEKAIALRDAYPEAHYCLGVLFNKAEEYKAALKHLKLAVKYNPDYAEAYYAMKETYEGMRDFDKAVQMLKKATALRPNYKM
jgi:tetratricopeptide (TPR) repeat protein